jgi:Na+-driven multidrug efflux pump
MGAAVASTVAYLTTALVLVVLFRKASRANNPILSAALAPALQVTS